MTYGFAISQQLELLINSLGFDFLLGVFYRIIMAVRKEISEKKAVYIVFDILFCVAATILTFCFFLVYTDGQIRLISLLSACVGLMIYLFSADFLLKKLLHYPIRLMISGIKILLIPFSAAIRLIKKCYKATKEKTKTNRRTKKTARNENKKRRKETQFNKRKTKEKRKSKDAVTVQ